MSAQMDKALLEGFGLQAIIQKDDCGGMRPHLQMSTGVRLLIRREDKDKAEAILSAQCEVGEDETNAEPGG